MLTTGYQPVDECRVENRRCVASTVPKIQLLLIDQLNLQIVEKLLHVRLLSDLVHPFFGVFPHLIQLHVGFTDVELA